MTIIGIDLGTTNSACSFWNGNQVELIPNRLGSVLTPSVVGLDEQGELIVGQVAKERLVTHPSSTVSVFKRLMGTQHRVAIAKNHYTAVELSALVLRSLKEDAEAHLGAPVTEAIISVPAYFNDNQRHATKLAGELVGLKVRRLINEPTAAAMAYGLHEKKEGLFIILDMGGGTFDVSILEYFNGVMEVHASAGDNFLGGEDFVEAMVEGVLAAHQLNREDLATGETQRLYMQMESAKRRISQDTDIELSLSLAGQERNWTLTEAWFQKQITPLLLRVRKPIEQALSDASIRGSEIDEVILVGGATKSRHFRDTVARLFGRFPAWNIDPDLVVCIGTGVQAGLVAKDAGLDDVVLTDVCPYTLGTEVNGPNGVGGHFLPIIERNSVVPISVVRTVQTAQDNQTVVQINIYQGEHRLVKKNVFLGDLSVRVPKGPAGKELIDIRYSYDMNGLLEVDATVVSTGKTASAVIQNSPSAMSAAEIEKSQKRLAQLKFHPREHEDNRQVLARAERMYECSLGERREQIGGFITHFEQILDKQNPNEIHKAREKFEEVLGQLDTEEWF